MSIDTAKIDLEVFSLDGAGGADLDPQLLIAIFHRWIQRRQLDDLAIDVIDYSHVPDGGAVLLVFHDGIFSLNRREGRWSLLYSRRRETAERRLGIGSLRERLVSVFVDALELCAKLEGEPEMNGALRLGADHFRVTINDRRIGRESGPELVEALQELAVGLFPEGASAELESGSGDRLAVELRSAEAPGCEALLGRMRAVEAAG